MLRLLTFLLFILAALPAPATTIARWDFNSIPSDADATTGTLTPVYGAGVASLVGGVTATFTAPNGSSDPEPADNSNWRITTWPAQGTQNKLNGIQFKVSTVGRKNISLQWDLRTSNTASKYTRLQYTTNGTDFLDHRVIIMPFETWMNSQTASFKGVPGVDDNPNFGVRFVTEFESTATSSGLNGYVPCNPTNNYGSAGTLRFDMVFFLDSTPVTNLSVLSYNILGHDATNWSLANPQVQAIGRVLSHLQPDIVGFQEVPEAYYPQMPGFLAVYLPGYQFAASSQQLDGAERSGIASRYPIMRSQSWLARVSLANYGYAGVYTRDLFEAQVAVPGFTQPFHFFTTHLKAFNDPDSAPRRAAESLAVSNFFATVYLTTNSLQPYALVGDMNEDYFRPRSYELGAITNLISAPTGLRLTNPLNPVTHDERTWSSQNVNPSIRFDYVLPNGLLFSNIASSQVFRADKVNPAAPPLLGSDCATASDHYPVQMVFQNPYTQPFSILDLTISNQVATLRWTSTPGDRYRVEISTNLIFWQSAATNLLAPAGELAFQTPVASASRFFRIARER